MCRNQGNPKWNPHVPRWDQRYSDREVKASGVKGKPVEVSHVKDESDLPMDHSFLTFAVKPSNHEKRARWSTEDKVVCVQVYFSLLPLSYSCVVFSRQLGCDMVGKKFLASNYMYRFALRVRRGLIA